MSQTEARAAVGALCDVLRRENTALLALNIQGATLLLAEKTTATERLTSALKPKPKLPESARPEIAALITLAAENKALLERAMQAQKRVLACIARAVPRALGQAGSYNAGGRTRPPSQMPPITLTSQA